MIPKPTVYVVDDEDSVRVALARLLETKGYEVIQFSSGDEFMREADPHIYGCAIVDLRMPGAGGLDVQAWLVRKRPSLPIIFLTGHGRIETSVLAIRSGAVDFLTKPVRSHILFAAVNRALEESRRLHAKHLQNKEQRERFNRLSPREQQVLGLLAKGLKNKEIASELHITVRTVKAHRSKIMHKFQTRSLAEALGFLYELNN